MTFAPPASRNARCPCGSGRRYKDCHGALAPPSAPVAIEALLADALAAHQAGRLDDAAAGYQAALARQPDLFDALHMLGVVRFQQLDLGRARSLIAQAIALRPDVAEARRNLRLVDNAMKRVRASEVYERWIATIERRVDGERASLRSDVAAQANAPLISLVTPVFDPPEPALRQCLESVLGQTYPHWELCLADDASTRPYVRELLRSFTARDPRIKVVYRERNGHISEASNSALELASGPYVALLDHDDALAPHALAEVAIALSQTPEAAIVYSDEDKIDETGRRFEPYFKPDWNPALLRSQNYVSHLGVYRASLVTGVGAFRKGVEGAQDWDLVLRCSERVPARSIRHVAQVLYHWRAVQGSTARTMDSKDYAARAQERVVEDAFARHRQRVRLRRVLFGTFLEAVPESPAPRVSLFVLDRGDADPSAWRSFGARTNASVDVVTALPAPLDGRPRALGTAAATAINRIAAASTAELLVLVDGACTPPTDERFGAWCAWAMQPDVGPAAALIVDRRRDMAAGAFVLDPESIAVMPWRGEPEGFWGMAGRATITQNLSAVGGDALAVRRATWNAIGGLDTRGLVDRYHDVELSLRCLAAGFPPLWCPGVVLAHAQLVDDRLPRRAEDADAQTMRSRWAALLARDPAYNPNLARAPHLFDVDA